jgi:dipeptidyl aminopeptidase/acylaminoacyl peptidase
MRSFISTYKLKEETQVRPYPNGSLRRLALASRSRKASVALVLLFSFIYPAQAQVPAEFFFQAAHAAEAQLAPNGRKLAITSLDAGRRELRVIEFTPEVKARVIARFADSDVVNIQWVNDNRIVFSLGDETVGSGAQTRRTPGLFAVNANGEDFRELVRSGPDAAIGRLEGSRIKKLEPLPQNHILLATPSLKEREDESSIIVGRLNAGSDSTLQSITPFWLDTLTGRTKPAAGSNVPPNAVAWHFDDEGQPRAIQTRELDTHRMFWRAPGKDAWDLLHESKGIDPTIAAERVDLEGRLWVRTVEDGPGAYVGLTPYDFKAQRPQLPALVSAPGFDFEGDLVVDSSNGKVLGVRLHTDTEQTHWFTSDMQGLQDEVDSSLPNRVNRILCGPCQRNPGEAVVVFTYSDKDPGRYLHFNRKEKRWTQLGAVQPGIDPQQMATVDLHRVRTRDGAEMPVWLTLPKGLSPKSPVPAVVLVHGGPWSRGGYWNWDEMAQFLASRGYLVISPEFRGSTGYGSDWYQAGRKQWGQRMQDDLADALLWAQATGLATTKACVAGASYGGYSTLMALANHADLFACGIAWLAVTDLNLLVSGSWWVQDDIGKVARSFRLPELVGHPVEDAAMLKANSPTYLAGKIKAPLMMAVGEADQRVPMAHGERMKAALTEAGRPPQWVSYPDEKHGWSQAKTRIDFAQRIEAFLGKHLPVKP